MAESANSPFFVLEADTTQTDSDAAKMQYIEQSIRDNPEAFQKALNRLGDAATAGTLDLSAIDTELTTLEQGASGLLTKLFSKRYDMQIEYDDATEQALAADKGHRELLEKHRNIKSINSTIGPMKHEIVANPAAEPARDAVRRSRVAFYLARAIELQPQQTIQAQLPSAG